MYFWQKYQNTFLGNPESNRKANIVIFNQLFRVII